MLPHAPPERFPPPFAYGAVLAALLPPGLHVDAAFIGYIAVVGLVAHSAGFLSVRFAELVSGTNIHTEWCREWSAGTIFSVSVLHAAFTYKAPFPGNIVLPTFLCANVQLLYFDFMLWAPIGKRLPIRPAAASRNGLLLCACV